MYLRYRMSHSCEPSGIISALRWRSSKARGGVDLGLLRQQLCRAPCGPPGGSCCGPPGTSIVVGSSARVSATVWASFLSLSPVIAGGVADLMSPGASHAITAPPCTCAELLFFTFLNISWVAGAGLCACPPAKPRGMTRNFIVDAVFDSASSSIRACADTLGRRRAGLSVLIIFAAIRCFVVCRAEIAYIVLGKNHGQAKVSTVK